MLARFFFCLIFSVIGLNICAHEMNPARLIVEELPDNQYKAIWMYPAKNLGIESEIAFSGCNKSISNLPKLNGKYLDTEIILNCEDSIQGQSIAIKGLSRAIDALITIKYIDNTSFEGLVTVNDPSILIPSEVSLYPISYFWLGIEHLLSGIDHILFIFGLLFIIIGIGTLIKTITAFTIAHSITLALSVLGIFSLPQLVTEALIALTLIYLALEIHEKTFFKSTPWLLAFGFGLLHGFGFAGALTEIGIANESLLLSLLFFNLGIEAGQLLILPALAFIIWFLKSNKIQEFSNVFSSYCIGGIGSFWLIDRILNIIN
jgi:hypothetical protein